MLKKDFQLVFGEMVSSVEDILAIWVIEDLVYELSNNTEVLSCTSHAPVKVRVRSFGYSYFRSVCCHDIHFNKIIGHKAGIPLVAAKAGLKYFEYVVNLRAILTSQNPLLGRGPQYQHSRSRQRLA